MEVKYFTKKDPLLQNVLNQNKHYLFLIMKRADFSIVFDSEKEAKIIVDSVYPEIKHKIPKTQINTRLDGKKLSLTIEAKDISSLRAACNSYLRWINTAYNVEQKIKKII